MLNQLGLVTFDNNNKEEVRILQETEHCFLVAPLSGHQDYWVLKTDVEILSESQVYNI